MSELSVRRARILARVERRVWEQEFSVLQRFYLKLLEEGPQPVYDELCKVQGWDPLWYQTPGPQLTSTDW